MCSVAGVVGGISLVSGLFGTVSSVQSSKLASEQAKAQAQYNSAVLQRDAELAVMKGNDALAQGQKDQEEARRRYQASVAQQATEYGAGNITLDSGTSLNVMAGTAEAGELEALDIGAQAERQAKDYFTSAGDLQNQSVLTMQEAEIDQFNAQNQAIDSTLNGFNSFNSELSSLMSSKGTGPSFF